MADSQLTIWKFALDINLGGEHIVEMPQGAKIISVIDQKDFPTVYAIVSPEAEKEQIRFHVIGTGWRHVEPRIQTLPFVGTIKTHNGHFVWHVFYEYVAGGYQEN